MILFQYVELPSILLLRLLKKKGMVKLWIGGVLVLLSMNSYMVCLHFTPKTEANSSIKSNIINLI